VATTTPPNDILIDTGKIPTRRKLRFASLDELMADVMRIADAERAGTLRRLGNWTPGQAFGHIAGWMDYAFDGYPIRPPLPIKIMARLMKNRIITSGMRPGLKIPRTIAGTYCTDVLPLDEGLQRLQKACDRLRSAAPAQPNPMFGPLTHQQWIDLNLRHAELHLGFFLPNPRANATPDGGRDS
jgi:hypothetical protein